MRLGKQVIIFFITTTIVIISSFLYGHSANVDSILDKNKMVGDKEYREPGTKPSIDNNQGGSSDAQTGSLPSAIQNNANNATTNEKREDIVESDIAQADIPIVTPSSQSKDKAELEKVIKDWTTGFNKKDLNASCALFSKSVVADYRGYKERDYKAICSEFKKIFANKNMRYEYRYKIHNIHRYGNLAAIRITWYLHVFKDGKEVSAVQDEGMDILEKDDNDQWKIINYIAYQK